MKVLPRTLLLLVLGIVALLVFHDGPLLTGDPSPEPGTAPTPSTQSAVSPGADARPTGTETPIDFLETDLHTVAQAALARTLPITGTIRASRVALVKAKVAGELREITVREGMSVKAGEVIVTLEDSEFQLRVLEREAQLKSAESQQAQALRSLDNARALFARNFISRSALDAAQSGWEVASSQREAAVASLRLARKSLADTVLTAPLDGLVAERYAQPGERIGVDGRILSIVDLSSLEIEALVPAAEIGAIAIGQTVELLIEGARREASGTIARIAPATQAGTRSIPVYIALKNRDPAVRAGLFAQGRLAIEAREGILVIPAAAVRDVGARSFVYAVADNRLIERDVRLGMRGTIVGPAPDGTHASRSVDWVEVLEGLAVGDRIVATNLGTLRTGSPVRLNPIRPAG